jgi:hypothetical protein
MFDTPKMLGLLKAIMDAQANNVGSFIAVNLLFTGLSLIGPRHYFSETQQSPRMATRRLESSIAVNLLFQLTLLQAKKSLSGRAKLVPFFLDGRTLGVWITIGMVCAGLGSHVLPGAIYRHVLKRSFEMGFF